MTDKPAPALPAQIISLGSGGMLNANSDYRNYSATIPHGITPENILGKTYWKNHVRLLRPKDIIRAFAEDGTWEMWLTVIKPDLASVIVSELFRVNHASVETVEVDDLSVEWVSPPLQFCIVRKSTGERIRERLYPKPVAEQELLRLKSSRAA